MMSGSKLCKKSNYFNLCPESKRLAVGDWIYYILETSRYCTKRSRIKELHIKKGRYPLSLDSCNVLLDNGDKVNYNETYYSKEDAMEFLIEEVKRSIVYRKQAVASQLREIEYEERLLKMFEKRLKVGKRSDDINSDI